MAKSGREGEEFDANELKALLSDEIQGAISYDESELSSKRSRALEYYRGEMNDMAAAPNRSKVVSTDVADTIGWMLPGIIRVFTASDRMGEYEPVRRGDEEYAKQATDYCNHIFWKDNPGYRILWDSTHDSLLQANGIVKHWWDDTEECEYAEMSGMTAEQIALLKSEQGVEILTADEGEPQKVLQADEQGQMVEVEVPTYDIKIKRVKMYGRVRIECIEPENFLLDKDARFIEEFRFCAHRDEVSKSDLIEMGFDRDVVDGLQWDRGSSFTEEALSREAESHLLRNDVGHDSTRLIELFECYVKVDVDGDGVAEVVRAYYAGQSNGGELLDWEVWDDDVPFSDIPCEPVPHRWDARSITDETMDVQRIKTALKRQMMDNLYASNLPMMEVEQDSVINPEMLLSPKFGGLIWRKKGTMASAPITPHTVPFVADKVLAALEHYDQVIEKRTGVSRSTMALDPEALTNQTATANQNQKDSAYSQVELIARNQAELGWKRVFKQILRLVVKHQDRPRTIRLRDKWVDMDPRYWNSEMDVTINVGLGTGSRDRDMAMLGQVMQTQIMSMQMLAETGDMEQSLGMIPKIMATATKIAESAGIKNAEDYYPQINEQQLMKMIQTAAQKAGQPDPKLEADMQVEQMKIQANQQNEQIKAQANAVKEREQLAADLQTKEADRRNSLMLEQQKQAFEAQEKAKDRDLQWNIELLKLRSQADAQERGFMQSDKERDDEMRANGKHPETQDALHKSLSGLAKALRASNGPKRVVRGADGRVEGVEIVPMPDEDDEDPIQGITRAIESMNGPRRVVRGEDGRAVGVETVVN